MTAPSATPRHRRKTTRGEWLVLIASLLGLVAAAAGCVAAITRAVSG